MAMGAVEILNLLSVPKIVRALNRQRVLVLMYHGVLPDAETLAEDDWLQVRCSEFAAQMDFLRRHYHPVRMEDLNRTLR